MPLRYSSIWPNASAITSDSETSISGRLEFGRYTPVRFPSPSSLMLIMPISVTLEKMQPYPIRSPIESSTYICSVRIRMKTMNPDTHTIYPPTASRGRDHLRQPPHRHTGLPFQMADEPPSRRGGPGQEPRLPQRGVPRGPHQGGRRLHSVRHQEPGADGAPH